MKLTTIALGRLGRDWEKRMTPNGKAVFSTSMACDVGTSKNKQTQWLKLTAWEKAGEILAEYSHKGSLLFVEGLPSVRAYQLKGGELQAEMMLTVREFSFLDKKDNTQETKTSQPTLEQPDAIFDQELPF